MKGLSSHTRLIWTIFLVLVAPLSVFGKPPATVRVLTIGNSFAENAVKYLPQLARAAGREVRIFEANLPSHSLEQHLGYLKHAIDQPVSRLGHVYKGPRGETAARSLVEVVASEPWDVITLQQVSHLSHKRDSFQPYLGQLVAYLRMHAPQARILLHQTWSYREDHRMYRDGFSSAMMAAQIAENYRAFADALQLDVVPVGEAFQLVRQDPAWTFRYPDPDFDYEHPALGSIPRQPGSLNRGWVWRRKPTTGADELNLDAIHANVPGCYLAGAVWFEVIFQTDVTDNSFRPAELSEVEAAFLRQVARRAASPSIEESPRTVTLNPASKSTDAAN